MRVHKVYARKNAIWAFTVVGRPPQEDTSFGQLIHEMTGNALKHEIPGLKEVHAVDAAGVHPLLLAIGSERYTPYAQTKQPAEILTIANHALGTGQLSLAKFLFITADETNQLSTHHIESYFKYILERIDLTRDIHFYTKTTIDTLDYSGENLNSGSKVVIASYGDVKRTLSTEVPSCLKEWNANIVMPGIVAIQSAHEPYANQEVGYIQAKLEPYINELQETPMIILCDDADFVAEKLNNFLWVTFTRCNPSHDLHGVGEYTEHKHWGCKASLIIDARIKPHHAPPVEKDVEVEKRVDQILSNYKF
jgi:4-hydroxy-3-polyprenylbenzoate decarboxylase